jgi:hypothetical protein
MAAQGFAKIWIGRVDDLAARDHAAQSGIRTSRIVEEMNPKTTDREVVNVISHGSSAVAELILMNGAGLDQTKFMPAG